jgi:hypothetical protein
VSDILGILRSFEPRADNPRILVTHALQATRDAAMEEFDALRADIAKAQAESEAAAKRWDEENASLAAQLAKAQARCAELEAVVREIQHNCDCGDGCANCERCEAALASDGTSALAAVRLAQRALTGEAGPL